jgi:lysozyme
MSRKKATTRTAGIDVSSWQGTIDWPTVAESKKFAFIRVAHGAHLLDARFPEYWKGAKAAGMLRGPYHYFSPQESLDDQIHYFIKTVGKLLPGDLPPVLDLEEPEAWKPIPQDQRLVLIQKWLDAVENAFGIKPMIYLSPNFVGEVLGVANAQPLKNYKLWIANYKVAEPHVPQPWTSWEFWQYSETGVIDGIKDNKVDLDWYNGTFDSLKALTLKRKPRKKPGAKKNKKHKKNGKKHSKKNKK